MIDHPESDKKTPEGAESEKTEPAADTGAADAAETEVTSDSGAAEPDSKKTDTKEQASVMRELLATRREAEQVRGDASRLREEAAAEADRMVSQAQELATQLVDEARTEADLMGEAARTHANALTKGAEEESLRLRKEVAEEVAATRLRAEAAQRVQLEEGQRLIREAVQEAASSVTDLRTRLGSALDSISAVESRLLELTEAADIESHADTVQPTATRQVVLPPAPEPQSSPEPTVTGANLATRVASARSGPVIIETKQSKRGAKHPGSRTRSAKPEETTEPKAGVAPHDMGEEGRPLGWLFRASQR